MATIVTIRLLLVLIGNIHPAAISATVLFVSLFGTLEARGQNFCASD